MKLDIRRPWPSPRPGRRLGPPEVWILSFLNPCHAHTPDTPPQGHRNSSRAPHGRSNGFFYRLPFATPQTLQTFQLLQKFAHLRRETAPHGRSNGFFYRSMPTGTPRPQQWLLRLLMGVQACRLPALKPLKPLKPSKPSNSSKSLPTSAGKRHPTAAAMASFIGPCQQAPQGHNNGFLGFLWASKPAVCQPLNP